MYNRLKTMTLKGETFAFTILYRLYKHYAPSLHKFSFRPWLELQCYTGHISYQHFIIVFVLDYFVKRLVSRFNTSIIICLSVCDVHRIQLN